MHKFYDNKVLKCLNQINSLKIIIGILFSKIKI